MTFSVSLPRPHAGHCSRGHAVFAATTSLILVTNRRAATDDGYTRFACSRERPASSARRDKTELIRGTGRIKLLMCNKAIVKKSET